MLGFTSRSLSQCVLLLILISVISVIAVSAPPSAPTITSAQLDALKQNLTINGTNFGTTLPEVKLSGVPLGVQPGFTDTKIATSFPVPLPPPGSYLLSVTTTKANLVAVFTITIERDGKSPVGTFEPAGANCATGGIKYTNGDGTTSYVCNGLNGLTGATGSPGAPSCFPYADCDGNPNTNPTAGPGAGAATGCESFLLNDPNNCGACGFACSGDHIVNRTCDGFQCNGACMPGFADCNGNKGADGCEASLNSDVNNCGGCGIQCGQGQACSNGACVSSGPICVPQTEICGNGKDDNCDGQIDEGCGLTCSGGQTLCNGSCINTGTSLNNCGGCGTTCTAVSECAVPSCTVGQCAQSFKAAGTACSVGTCDGAGTCTK